MKFSIRQLLGFVIFAGLAASLSRFPPYFSLVAILVAIVIPSHFFVSLANWRRVAYGGLLGVFGALVTMLILSFIFYGHMRQGSGTGYGGLSVAEMRFREALEPFIVPVGFLLGATLFLVLKQNGTSKSPVA